MNAGDTVSHYRILSPLGSGGMGVVYLAEDLTLGRKVALKFLSRDFASDRNAVERFWREARTASALNHPNICTIHEIAEHDGQPFIAMEYLEGQSLRDFLRARRLSLDVLLTLAIDVADGLGAAHSAGVVHRDIKPANIFVLAGTRAKLLDFGLAKMETPSSLPDSNSPTNESLLTNPGRAVGTVAYMSPEQAKGETLDARSDLFSLGVVLYEAVTGVAPFQGSSTAVVYHEILGKAPAPPLRLNPETPPDLDRLIMKALEKDRDVRCQSAAEMLSDLKRLKRDRESALPSASGVGASVTMSAAKVMTHAAAGSPSSSSDVQVAAELLKRHRTAMVVGTIALVLVIVGVFYAVGKRPRNTPATSAQDFKIDQITFTGDAAQPAISPDGKFVAYVSKGGIWIRQIATQSNFPIVQPENGFRVSGLTVSPDNDYVDFVRVPIGSAKAPSLWRIPLLGQAPPKLLMVDVHSPVGWSPDGLRMAFIRSNAEANPTMLIVADADGKNQKVLVTAKLPELRLITVLIPGPPPTRPEWSPDGRVIVYSAVSVDSDGRNTPIVAFVNTSDRTMRTFPAYGFQSAWLNDTSLIFTGRDGQLGRFSYPDGGVTRVTNELSSFTGVSVGADRNTLVTARVEEHGLLWIGNGDATEGTESAQRLPGSTAFDNILAWNKDRLEFTGQTAIFALSPNGEPPEEILKSAASPAFTSDGKTMVYQNGPAAGFNRGLWRADDNGLNPVPLVADGGFWPVITPDDRYVIYGSFATNLLQMWIVPLAGGTPRLLSPAWANSPDISPDGKQLAFGNREQTRWFISVCNLPDCSSPRPVRQMDVQGFRIRWTRDGRGIAYSEGANIFVHPLDGSPERQLSHFTSGPRITDFAWSRYGKQLAVTRYSSSQDIVVFRGIKPAQ